MLRVDPFEPWHFFMVKGREGKIPDSAGWIAKLYYERSFYPRPDGSLGRSAETIVAGNDKVVGCYGGAIFGTMCEIWMHISQELADQPIFMHRAVSRLYRTVRDEAGLLRMQTAIELSKAVNRRWITSLGLNEEGVARKFGPNGEDCMRYAWIKGD